MPGDSLNKELFQIREVDLTHLLEIEPCYVPKKVADSLDNVPPAKRCRSLVEPSVQPFVGKTLGACKQLVEYRVPGHTDNQLGDIFLFFHYRGKIQLNPFQLLIKKIPNTSFDSVRIPQNVDRDRSLLTIPRKAPNSLVKAHWIPRHVYVYQNGATFLQVNSLSTSPRRYQKAHVPGVESFRSLFARLADCSCSA